MNISTNAINDATILLHLTINIVLTLDKVTSIILDTNILKQSKSITSPIILWVNNHIL